MIIKDRKKFLRGIALIIGITIVLIFIMTSKAFSHQEVTYKTVSVTYGDTLWDIAENEKKTNSYYKGCDIREIIHDIKQINNLENTYLSVNQILEIPIY